MDHKDLHFLPLLKPEAKISKWILMYFSPQWVFVIFFVFSLFLPPPFLPKWKW